MKVPKFLGRWLKFGAVGVIGIGVQLGMLAVLYRGLGLQYLVATALAVEFAVLHNFVWHELWTWRDRNASRRGVWGRLLRFNLTTGVVSLAVNLVFMRLLMGWLHLEYLLANLISIAAGTVANYLCADLWVFSKGPG